MTNAAENCYSNGKNTKIRHYYKRFVFDAKFTRNLFFRIKRLFLINPV